MTEPLRIILVLVGVIVIAGVYLWGRQRRRHGEAADFDLVEGDGEPLGSGDDEWEVIPIRSAREEALDDTTLAGLSGLQGRDEAVAEETLAEAGGAATATDAEAVPVSTPDSASEAKPEPEPRAAEEERIVVLTLMAAEEERPFTGPSISEALDNADMRFGERGIFHHIDPATGEAVFSLSNAVEPGIFELATLHALKTPGLAMFLQLPGPVAGPVALETMVQTGRQLAAELGGYLCDQRRRPLDDAALAELRRYVA